MNLSRFLRRALARFHGDEHGATMTEFVAFLPIFVTLFAGLSHLHKLGRVSVETKIQANKLLWTESYELQQNEMRWSPRTTAITEVSESSGDSAGGGASEPDTGGGDILSVLQTVDTVAEGVGGHWADSYIRGTIMPVTVTPHMIGASGDAKGGRRIDAAGGPFFKPSDVLGDAPLANYALNDTVMFNTSGSTLEQVTSFVFNTVLGGTQHGVLVGTRFGYADGAQSKSITLLGQNISFSASYRTRISPVAFDSSGQEIPIIGVTVDMETGQYVYYQLLAQTNDNYRNTLNLLEQNMDPDDSRDVPTYPTSPSGD